jgi:hypothetical protein
LRRNGYFLTTPSPPAVFAKTFLFLAPCQRHGTNEQIFGFDGQIVGFIEQASERLTDKVTWENQRISTFALRQLHFPGRLISEDQQSREGFKGKDKLVIETFYARGSYRKHLFNIDVR